jgi:hypothetical protein
VLRIKPFQEYLSGVLVVLAAVALTGCEGGVEMTNASALTVRVGGRGNAPARSASLDVDGDGRPELVAKAMAATDDDQRGADRRDKRALERDDDHGQRAGNDDPDQRGAERGDDESALHTYALSPARAREIDLEFSPGVQEPSQEEVAPAPPAWKPAADAEGSAKPVIDDVWPDKAPSSGGERVVIRGRNLQTAQIVFGLVPARIIEASDDKVTVAAPAAGAEQVAIVLTNRDGNYAVAANAFQYYK